MHNDDLRYIEGTLPGGTNKFGFAAERGVTFDNNPINTGSVVFFSRNINSYESTGEFFTNINAGLTKGLSLDNIFFSQSFLKNLQVGFDTVNDGGTEIQVLRMDDNKTPSRNIENLLLLCLTQSEMTTLSGLSGLKNNHHKFLKLTDESHNVAGGFYKYKLKVQGLDATTLENNVKSPPSDIWVYTKDGLIFATAAFTGSLPIPTTVSRNDEEKIGETLFNTSNPEVYTIDNVVAASNLITFNDTNAYYQLGLDTKFTHAAGSFTVKDTQIISGKTQVEVLETIPNTVIAGNTVNYSMTFENHFIGLDRELGISTPNDKTMRELVNTFQKQLLTIPDSVSSRPLLENLADQYGRNIFHRAVETVKLNNYANPDDRSLYWSRLRMEVYLKNHPFLKRSDVDKEALFKRFEEKSRNYVDVDFSTAPTSGSKKILITGFDPFLLNDSVSGENIRQSNPSGSCALALHGEELGQGGNLGYIQVMIVPTRWTAFDRGHSSSSNGSGIVEEYITQYIGGPSDMIITISQSGYGNFNIDRFATINRNQYGAFHGNLREDRDGDSDSVILGPNEQDLTWIETTLPKAMISKGDGTDPVPDTWKHYTVYYQTYVKDPSGSDIPKPLFNMEWDSSIDNLKPKTYSAIQGSVPMPTPNLSTADRIKGGSGGSYMSNEIFYRVALARERWQRLNLSLPKFSTGHFHVAKLQSGKLDLHDLFRPRDYLNNYHTSSRTIIDEQTKLILTVKDRIKRGIIAYNNENDLL